MDNNKFVSFREKIQNNIGKVIVGKEEKIDKIIVAFICSGHVLLEDIPGLGKTKLSKALAKTLNCTFKRVQFTPDLLPSDLTGIYYYNQKSAEFELKKGPLMSNIVLADEINRATPRTQSALLECMEERQVTIEGNTLKLDSPFFVIATQNPIEQFGTFPLPEAQMDRFFMRLSMGYPEYEEERAILNKYMNDDPLEKLESVISMDEIKYVQQQYSNITVSEEIKTYILDIISETRKSYDIELGASPRASLNLMRGAQALAAISGRDYVIPEDIKSIAISIIAHRLTTRSSIGSSRSDSQEKVLEDILNKIETPLEKL
ncbi:AAA family ATPase [Clostridium folliculivorans]|uniref:ATPase n=1 Tax=Clostridium folliculivorans TaxID=2886038 RepID=A0A9W5Y5D6_9CLOT|nr:MoxR family ATPase [Clostridium folliculivorans]GKU26890.1 ATPase [Clostridium folliculivorans]GKU31541.1 ATPase [Clostridium folliculivorans]